MKGNWDHLRYFNALASHGTLSEAARHLGVSHSTVQRHINAFEQELQVQLFYNGASGFKLTSAGKTLHLETADIQRTLTTLSTRLANTDEQLSGQVSITVPDTIGHFIIPDLLQSLTRHYPKIDFSISVLNKLSNIADLEADIAIRTGGNPAANLIGRQAGNISLAVCASKNYLSQHALTPDSALGTANNFIMLDDSFDRETFHRWLPKSTDDKQIIRVNGFLTAWRLCSADMGLTLLPAYLLKHDNNIEEIVSKTLPDNNPLWILSHADLRDSSRVKAVRQHLTEKLTALFG